VAGWRNPTQRPSLVWWLTGIAVLFSSSAWIRDTVLSLWYEVGPFVKKTRAPGMALYIVSFVLAVFARLARRDREQGAPTAGRTWMIVGGVLLVLPWASVRRIAESLRAVQAWPAEYLAQFRRTAQSAAGDIRMARRQRVCPGYGRWLVFLFARGRIEGRVLALALRS